MENMEEIEELNSMTDIEESVDDVIANVGETVKDELKDIILKDSRMCHFVADLIAGKTVDEAVASNLKIEKKSVQISESTINEACESMRWSGEQWESVANGVEHVYAKIRDGELSKESLMLLCRGMVYEDEVADAEQRGYVKGRNEKIELLKRGVEYLTSTNDKNQKQEKTKSILENPRRSIWDE